MPSHSCLLALPLQLTAVVDMLGVRLEELDRGSGRCDAQVVELSSQIRELQFTMLALEGCSARRVLGQGRRRPC